MPATPMHEPAPPHPHLPARPCCQTPPNTPPDCPAPPQLAVAPAASPPPVLPCSAPGPAMPANLEQAHRLPQRIPLDHSSLSAASLPSQSWATSAVHIARLVHVVPSIPHLRQGAGGGRVHRVKHPVYPTPSPVRSSPPGPGRTRPLRSAAAARSLLVRRPVDPRLPEEPLASSNHWRTLAMIGSRADIILYSVLLASGSALLLRSELGHNGLSPLYHPHRTGVHHSWLRSHIVQRAKRRGPCCLHLHNSFARASVPWLGQLVQPHSFRHILVQPLNLSLTARRVVVANDFFQLLVFTHFPEIFAFSGHGKGDQMSGIRTAKSADECYESIFSGSHEHPQTHSEVRGIRNIGTSRQC